MGACILREGDVLSFVSVLRALNKLDYSIDDERILRRLAPHLRRAFEVHRRLVSAELTRAASIEVLDAVETGVFLLDEDRRVLFENAAARRIVARADGIAVTREGRLTATSPSARSRLERCVSEACRTGVGDGSEAGGSFAVERARHAPPYGVIVSPLRMPATPSIARRPAAVVLIGDPERPAPLPQLLREVFGLTPAQSAFAAQLAGGDSVEASAEALGITVGTARWTLKQIFLRTGTSRQSELVRLIDSLPRRPDDGKL